MAGALFGFSFFCRFQIGFMIAGLFGWLIFILKIRPANLLLLFAGIFLAALPAVLADKWLYGQWVFSPWNYLDLNLFQGKASQFGHEPFYYYLSESLLQLIPPFSVLVIMAMILFWIRFSKHVVTWVTLPFILLHFFVGHKELRFLFPVLNFLPCMILLVIASLKEEQNRVFIALDKKWMLGFAVTVNVVALLYFTFKPADQTSLVQKKIYDLVRGNQPLLLYENNNPYNNLASLNYFRNVAIRTVDLKAYNQDTVVNEAIYYFSEKLDAGDLVVKDKQVFIKLYSNFPAWFSYLDFNGWLERSGTFTIYRMVKQSKACEIGF